MVVLAAEKDLLQERDLQQDLVTIHSATEKDQLAKALHAADLAAENALLDRAVVSVLAQDLLDLVAVSAAVNALQVLETVSANVPAAHAVALVKDHPALAATISETPKDHPAHLEKVVRHLEKEDLQETENLLTDPPTLVDQLQEKLGRLNLRQLSLHFR